MCEYVLEFFLQKQKTLVQVVGCLTLYLIFLHGIKMKIIPKYLQFLASGINASINE